MSMLGKHKISIEVASLADGDSIASYLVDASGNLLTSSLVGAKQALDSLTQSEHLDGAAYAAGVDYLSSMGAVDESGNWQPLNIDAAGNLLVTASVSFTAEHNEDSASASGDSLIGIAAVRQDVLATDTSDDGDYSFIKVNALGEQYVHDTDVLAQLVTANVTLSNIDTSLNNIEADVDEINTSVNNIEAWAKAEDSVHSSGDLGIQALAVRKDSQGSNAADGDYTSLLTWSEGSLKVVDIANGTILQQQKAITSTATTMPTTALANRKSLLVQNAGSASIWVGSATVTTSGATAGIEVPKQSFIELDCGPAVTAYGITAGASQNANILETA